jgi:hypothetical protein
MGHMHVGIFLRNFFELDAQISINGDKIPH